MPSQKTASKPEVKKDLIKCQVMRAIGVDANEETLKHLERRAKSKGIKFAKQGLTTMIHPNKDVFDKDKKDFVKGEPVYVDLERDVARKLQATGAVSAVI